jgi:archaellum component FlaF (FlaF/FlaG flagellin family)
LRLYRRLRASRRGQATAIGAVFFFMIVVLTLNFLYETIQIQSQMRDIDTQKAQEQLTISGVLFGASSTYTTPTYTVTTGTGTPPTGVTSATTSAVTFPISNMNFTESSSGWSFATSYNNTNMGAIGAFDGTDGAASGVGSIFADFSISGTGTYEANMTWSTRFYWDSNTVGAPSSIKLSYTRKTTQTSSRTKDASLRIKLVAPNGTYYLIRPPGAPAGLTEDLSGSTPDTSWVINYNIDVPVGWMKGRYATGFYTVRVETWAQIQPGGSVRSEFKEYFDDIGLRVTWEGQVCDWYASFTLSETELPGTVSRLDVSYTGHYDTEVRQGLYIYSFPRSSWVLLATTTVSTSSVTVSKALTTVDVQDYISSAREIRIRIYAVKTTGFTCTADSIQLIDYYSSNTNVSVTLTNNGSTTVTVVSLWINGPTGHNVVTQGLPLYIGPGETKSVNFTHTWTAGQYTLKAVTSRGTIATLVTFAA